PWTTRTPACEERMISSCSAWIVPTMSPSWPVRRDSSAASRVEYPESPDSPVTPRWPSPNSSSSRARTSRPFMAKWRRRGRAHRPAPGGRVDRLGAGGPPVDDDRVPVGVGHREAADVERLGGLTVDRGSIDSAEDQRGVAEIELREALDQRLVEHIALVS